MPEKASIDEFMTKRRGEVGKTGTGQEVVFKGFRAPPTYHKDDAGNRSAEFVMSSERIDRDGDIVRQRGLGVVEFKKNPQALLFHSSRSWPVGKWSDIKKVLGDDPPHTDGKMNFLPPGGPVAEVDQAAWMVEHDAIRTVSIGFMPLDLELIEHDEKVSPWGYGFDIKASELYECSLVPIPAQPDARVKDMLSKGEMAPAREMLELALDEWAKDPRTAMFVPRKELEATYRRVFGKNAVVMMALDAAAPREKSALFLVERAIEKACEEHGIKAPTVDFSADAPADPAIDANSGIQINITISQGATGTNTRNGTEAGDTGTAAANQGQTPAGQQQLSAPEPRRKSLVDVLWARLFGADDPSAPIPAVADEQATHSVPVAGSYKAREDRIAKLEARLHEAS